LCLIDGLTVPSVVSELLTSIETSAQLVKTPPKMEEQGLSLSNSTANLPQMFQLMLAVQTQPKVLSVRQSNTTHRQTIILLKQSQLQESMIPHSMVTLVFRLFLLLPQVATAITTDSIQAMYLSQTPMTTRLVSLSAPSAATLQSREELPPLQSN
jgi:hypothetical protein